MKFFRPELLLIAAGLGSMAGAAETAFPLSTIGVNSNLAAGADALRAGRWRTGIELTLAGLQQPNPPHTAAAALSNLCAGYNALREYALALRKCNESIELDARNWRAYNNRAAANVGLGLYEAALADVKSALRIAPDSELLAKTLRIVKEHKRRADEERRKSHKA